MLDFHGVGYINSTGIALIVGLLARARTNGQTPERPRPDRRTTARSSRSPGWPTS